MSQPVQSSLSHAPADRHMVAVRLSAMGDAALTTGVLQCWRDTLDLSFTVLTKAAFAPLFARHPAVRNVIGLEADDLNGKRQRDLFRKLAADYNGIPLLDLHGTLRTRMLSLLWKGPIYRYPKQALSRRFFLLSKGKFRRNALLARNVPQRYAAALASLDPQCPNRTAEALKPHFFVGEEETAWSRDALAPLIRQARPLVALHPFATHPAKMWPAAHWQELALSLTRRGILYFWVGQGDASSFAPRATAPEGCDSLDVTNRTSLRQLIALLDQADALVTGDSGPMHLADGVDTPVLALFGPTCREWGFFPSAEHDRVLQIPLACRPCSLHGKTGKSCDHACMTGISPAIVLQELTSMLEESRQPHKSQARLLIHKLAE